MSIIEADSATQSPFDRDVSETQRYFDSPRFEGITRLYTARQVVEQRGTIPVDLQIYPRILDLQIARDVRQTRQS